MATASLKDDVQVKGDVQDHFDEVIAGVSHKWDDLARKLGFDENEIDGIHILRPDQDRRCREVLRRWRNKNGKGATLLVLKKALIRIDERLTAESLQGYFPQQPAKIKRRKRSAEPTEETDKGWNVLKDDSPPLLPIVVDILAQVEPSVKTPKEFLTFASASKTLITLDITAVPGKTLRLLEQIKPEIKTTDDLVDITEAIKVLEEIKGVCVAGAAIGSLLFYLECEDLSGLGELWFMFKSGKLNELLLSRVISKETLKQLCAESISVSTTIKIQHFRDALIYLLTTQEIKGHSTHRLPREYPLYQPHIPTTYRLLDILHLDVTHLVNSDGTHYNREMPRPTQTENSQVGLGSKFANLQIVDDQQTTDAPKDTGVSQVMSELASLDIRELEQLMGQRMKRTFSMDSDSSGYQSATPGSGLSRPDSPTGEHGLQATLETLLAELNTPAVMEDKAQQFDLYCQIGDLYRTKLHNIQPALQYYQNMLECSQTLSEQTKQAKAYSRLGLTCDVLEFQQEALKNHERALDIYKVEAANETDICVAYKNLASSLALSGQVSDAKTNYESALAVAMETGNKAEQMDINLKLGDLHIEPLHEPQVSHKYYTETLALARDLGRKDRERLAYNRLGQACVYMQDMDTALEWHQKDLKMSEDDVDDEGQLRAHQNLGNTYRLLDKLDQATSHFNTVLQMALQTGNEREEMVVYNCMGDMQREQLHSPQKSIQYYQQQLALARQLMNRNEEKLACNRLGTAHYEMGEYETALEWYQKELNMSQDYGDKIGEITAHTTVGNTYRRLGKLDEAASHFNTALEMAQQTGYQYGQMRVYLCMGEMHREQLQSPQTSIQYYEQQLALARRLLDRQAERLAYCRLGHAQSEMGGYEAALEWYQKHMKMAVDVGSKREETVAHVNVGNAYRFLGKLDQAESHFNTALQMALRTDEYGQIVVRLSLGDMHREQLHSQQNALGYYRSSRVYAKRCMMRHQEGRAYKKLGKAHCDMGEFETALKWFQKYLKVRQESGDKTEQITAHKYIADACKGQGKLDLARSHCQQAMDIAMETGNKQAQDFIAKELADM